ncbi:MAG: hypothetical protein K2H23_04715 [Oscillospiraceae bacterium]|nr:hypothetical protein [Oscillospiraceae bacterium]
MDINYHLPSFTDHYSLNLLIFDYMKEHPEYFRDGIKIASVFGSFAGAMWNGGRNVPGNFVPELSQKIIKAYNDRGIPLRFTFTNPMLTERQLADKPCNEIMKMADNGLNQVIVMSSILEEYIRENYPNYKITSSTCKQIRDMNDLNAELDKDYNLVVIDYNWNNKFDELALIKDKPRCEILVNACCQPACPRRGDHYSAIGKYQIELCTAAQSSLGIKADNIVQEPFPCPYMDYDIYQIKEFSTHISPDDIESKYIPMGFNQFKLEGRTIGDIGMLEMYVYYFAKPEFERRVRLDLTRFLTGRIKYFNVLPV